MKKQAHLPVASDFVSLISLNPNIHFIVLITNNYSLSSSQTLADKAPLQQEGDMGLDLVRMKKAANSYARDHQHCYARDPVGYHCAEATRTI